MLQDFTITIQPLRIGFVRENSQFRPSPIKMRKGSKYVYSWSTKWGTMTGFMQQTEACHLEEERLKIAPLERALKALEKAEARWADRYGSLRYEEEIIGKFAPYPSIPTATKSIMSDRWNDRQSQRRFLNLAEQKLKGKIHAVIKSYQDKTYKNAKGCLYDLNMTYLELCRVGRPDHHKVFFKNHDSFIESFRKKKKK